MINFYRRFLLKAAETLAPLNSLLCNNIKAHKAPVKWTAMAQRAFEESKESLAQAALLAHPRVNAELAVFADASEQNVGAALQQRIGSDWEPFFSRKLSPAERKYSAFDRELLAIYLAVKYFRHMLEAREFSIYTDHKPLTFAFGRSRKNARHDNFGI